MPAQRRLPAARGARRGRRRWRSRSAASTPTATRSPSRARSRPAARHGDAPSAGAITLHVGGRLQRAGPDRLRRLGRPRRHGVADLHRRRRPGDRPDLRGAAGGLGAARTARSASSSTARTPSTSPITYDIVTPPALGTLDPAGDGPEPSRDYHAGAAAGTDTFTYRATSENGNSNTVTQTVTISSTANTDPECFSNSGFPETAATERPRTLDPFCFDGEDDPLHYTKLTNPAHGTVSDAGGTLVYTSAAGYTGPDQFTYSAADALGGTSAPTTFFVNVVAVQAPTCPARATVSVRPNRSRFLDLSCTDALGDPLTYVIDGQPAKGTLDAGTGAFRTYTAGAVDRQRLVHVPRPQPDDGRQRAADAEHHDQRVGQQRPDLPVDVLDTSAKPGQQRTITPTCTDADADPLSFAKESEPVARHADQQRRRAALHGDRGLHGPGLVHLPRDRRARRPVGGVDGRHQRLEREHGAHLRDRPVRLHGRRPARSSLLPAAPCSDGDGDTLTIEIPSGPAHGTLTANRTAPAPTRRTPATRGPTRSRSAPSTARPARPRGR